MVPRFLVLSERQKTQDLKLKIACALEAKIDKLGKVKQVNTRRQKMGSFVD